MQDLWNEIEHDKAELRNATSELLELGREAARAESAYQARKYSVALRLRTQGVPATVIGATIKGHPDVVDLMLARDIAQSDWETQKEIINTLKKCISVNEAQWEREWGQCR